MRFENIEVAVGVEIADADTHAGLLLAILIQRHAALQTALGERAVVVVAEQQAGRRVARDVDIGPAVAIEIGGHGGQRVAGFTSENAGLLADIGECSVTVVVVQTAVLLRQPLRTADTPERRSNCTPDSCPRIGIFSGSKTT